MKTLFRALYFLSLCGSVQLAAVAGWDTTQFEYEPRTGRLMRKVYADGKAISYTYHCGDLPKRITLASGKWRERHYDSRLNGAFYFPCYGSNSEITAYVNESGAVVASYIYGPFGEVNLFTGPMVDEFSFRFMTKRYDIAAGLYDFGARWYSPSLHRWLNRDPIAERGGLNIYAFCCNDPINIYDANGCAYFAKRALGGGRNGPISFGGNLTAFNDWLDRKNIELAHEQLFFQDGGTPSSVGYGKENLDGESMDGYVVTHGGYDDCVMRIAVEKVDPSPYSLIGSPFKKKYNCQDYADALREKYYEIRNSKAVKCKCRKKGRWGR